MPIGTLLLIIPVVFLIAALPSWPTALMGTLSGRWGWSFS
jgi:hypothetical protein